ncbi:MAG: hypothetical protein ABIJ72_01385 [bacterium]
MPVKTKTGKNSQSSLKTQWSTTAAIMKAIIAVQITGKNFFK